MLSEGEIRRCLSKYGVEASSLQCEHIQVYIALLLKWNRSISLTSITDETEILQFHFGESAFALSAVRGMHGRLADVGSGAGFPSLPIRIFNDRTELTLIESNSKKCAFLNEVVRKLRLAGTRVLRARYEDSTEALRSKIDVVVSRAIGEYDELLRWSAGVVSPQGFVIIWAGQDDAQKVCSTAGWVWKPMVQIPGSKRRFLVIGSPSPKILC